VQVLLPEILTADLYGAFNGTHTDYSMASPMHSDFESVALTCNNRHYFLKHWILEYQIAQTYFSQGAKLQTEPAIVTASVERQFLAHNSATVSFRVYNLLNQAAIAAQSMSATTVVQTSPTLSGRYFLINCLLNLRHFK
jgi:hypothetical protein